MLRGIRALVFSYPLPGTLRGEHTTRRGGRRGCHWSCCRGGRRSCYLGCRRGCRSCLRATQMIHTKISDQTCNLSQQNGQGENMYSVLCMYAAAGKRPPPAHKPQNTKMYIQLPNRLLHPGQHPSPRSPNEHVPKYHEIASQPMSNNNNSSNNATMQQPKKSTRRPQKHPRENAKTMPPSQATSKLINSPPKCCFHSASPAQAPPHPPPYDSVHLP